MYARHMKIFFELFLWKHNKQIVFQVWVNTGIEIKESERTENKSSAHKSKTKRETRIDQEFMNLTN